MASATSDEEDEDYKPDAGEQSSSDESDKGREAKRPRLSPQLSVEDKAKAAESRQAAWTGFQASLGAPSQQMTVAKEVKTIEIERKYRFAGKDVIERKLVDEDSEEAKQWMAATALSDGVPDPEPADDRASGSSTPLDSATATKRPRPGPRKPRIELISTKPKKLTMLQKSAMDWSAHLAESDRVTKEELEVNRRSGGALGKVDFLDRVGGRRQQELEKELGKKRRR